MSEPTVYIEPCAVSVQFNERGAYVTLHEDGTVTEQFREPKGRRVGGRGAFADPDEKSVA